MAARQGRGNTGRGGVTGYRRGSLHQGDGAPAAVEREDGASIRTNGRIERRKLHMQWRSLDAQGSGGVHRNPLPMVTLCHDDVLPWTECA